GLLRLDRQAENERAVNDNAGFVAGFGETAHLVHGDALFDAGQDVVIATFVADEEQTQSGVLEGLDRIVVEIGAAVATPGQAERRELFRNFTSAGKICGEGIVVEKEFLHLRKELLHVSHFVSDVLSGANTILVSADRLRPEAKSALGRTTTAG